MIEGLSIRQATSDDIDFVIEAIFESEKSGSQMVSSCNVFGISLERFKDILKEVLQQNLNYYDYFLSGFVVAEVNGEYAGALGSWMEAGGGTPSGIIKATILFQHIDKSRIKDINQNTRVIKGITPPREVGTLQLEHGYTKEKFRRQGVFTYMIRENIKRNYAAHPFSKVQGILFKENYKSYNCHLKFGYVVVDERTVDDPEVLKFFPYNTKVLMEFSGEKIASL